MTNQLFGYNDEKTIRRQHTFFSKRNYKQLKLLRPRPRNISAIYEKSETLELGYYKKCHSNYFIIHCSAACHYRKLGKKGFWLFNYIKCLKIHGYAQVVQCLMLSPHNKGSAGSLFLCGVCILTSSLGGFSMVFWSPPKSKDLLVRLAGLVS